MLRMRSVNQPKERNMPVTLINHFNIDGTYDGTSIQSDISYATLMSKVSSEEVARSVCEERGYEVTGVELDEL